MHLMLLSGTASSLRSLSSPGETRNKIKVCKRRHNWNNNFVRRSSLLWANMISLAFKLYMFGLVLWTSTPMLGEKRFTTKISCLMFYFVLWPVCSVAMLRTVHKKAFSFVMQGRLNEIVGETVLMKKFKSISKSLGAALRGEPSIKTFKWSFYLSPAWRGNLDNRRPA